jgi:hypothetical protein
VGCEHSPELVVDLAVAWHDECDGLGVGPVHASMVAQQRHSDDTETARTGGRGCERGLRSEAMVNPVAAATRHPG